MASKLVLVLNCGSSSLKFAIIDAADNQTHVSGTAECFNLADARIKWVIDGEKGAADLGAGAAHTEAFDFIVHNILAKKPELLANLIAIGHRVVHGGEQFTKSIVIDDQVLEGIKASASFAPLHNPAGLIGINEAQKVLPELKDKNVAVFDTAFHQTMEEEAYLYAIPYDLYEKHGVRRYGFHGTSHGFVSRQAAAILKQDVAQTNVITCHIGNGSSITAVVNGQSVDTSMGLTPLEGLVMGTRSGDIDPAIIFYLVNELKMDIKQVDDLLNKKSGILGLSGVSSDCRYLEDNFATDEAAKRTMQVLCRRLAKYIAAYSAVMDGRLDAIVFTGGIGENSAKVRELTLARLALLGVKLDPAANLKIRFGASGNIATAQSIPVLVIPTNEELVIAQDASRLVS